MTKYKAIKSNGTLKYTEGKEYEAKITENCDLILFIENDNRDRIIVNKADFEYVKSDKTKWGW